MKVRRNISISEEVNDILNKQPNGSEYIEKLVLRGSVSEDPVLQEVRELRQLLKQTLQLVNKPKAPKHLVDPYNNEPIEVVSFEDLV